MAAKTYVNPHGVVSQTGFARQGYSKCSHYGPTLAFTLNKCSLYGASRVEALAEQYQWDIMFSVAGPSADARPTNPVSMDKAAAELLPAGLREVRVPPFVAIDWPDGGTPNLGREWWVELTDYLIRFEGNVVFYCFGGHGRTGTALSIIACLAGLAPADECPVEWLRGMYCDKAVETNSQLDYIELITDSTVEAVGSHAYTAPAAKSYTGDGYGPFDDGWPKAGQK